ncbi:DUF4340 domain-containing protein [Treponema sp. OttesenSCG-928-L16]|nr:DUF4340 domain-containing protein [Treponema sp. OttesenSCG-928-L16]
MSKKLRNLIIALAVLLVLGGSYYGSIAWKRKKTEAAAPAPNMPLPRLGNLESSKLTKIEIPDIVLEKRDNSWELSSLRGGPPPGGIALDQNQIQSISYSLASIYIDRIADENPEDLSVYGLKEPAVRALITDSDGNKAEYLLGDMTPSRTSYYVMEKGKPGVHIISSYAAENMQFNLDKIRQKSLFPAFEFTAFEELHIQNGERRIEISLRPESVPPYLDSSFSSHIITSPYKLPRGVDGEALENLIAPLQNLAVTDFIDDSPSSLQPYGLDKPVRIILTTSDNSLDLMIGNKLDGKHYAKLADAPGVFTLSGMESLINVKPFNLIDKFALLINIDKVDHLSVIGGEKPLSADFQKNEDEGIYFLNGEKAETKSFKQWYQAVIGLLSDAEYPGPVRKSEDSGTGNIRIEYQLNTPPGERVSITLVPYNRDFYALQQEGTMEFLISRTQVRRIYETADAVIF